ncbi:serine O-acetyltransferase [Gelidibacter pelagius]|uniref:Serine acetyltransferase n=1 Tax=Gelidibacter pelagius TaxID=2819985 RepID=A0ABS3SY22_9FLAO|nr:serine acetyltransferase [Gelidibacter pelagius]MBO3100176.1 serine acetyltransferase [Gelidibacter pelagius]
MIYDKIKFDAYRIYPHKFSFKSFLKAYRNQGFRFIFFHRLYNNIKNPLLKIVVKIFLRHYCYKFGFQISTKTKIGKGVYFGHFGTVVINADAQIGEFCNINHNVTIGRQNRGVKKGSPTIGNKVWIGTGSVIVGNIIINDNVLIAPNAYVNFDVPENSIVMGNPGKIISKMNPTECYINNIKEL